MIPFCEQHHNSYHGKCTVYNLCHVNAKVIISLQIKFCHRKKCSVCVLMAVWLSHGMNITSTHPRSVSAIHSCWSNTAAAQGICTNSKVRCHWQKVSCSKLRASLHGTLTAMIMCTSFMQLFQMLLLSVMVNFISGEKKSPFRKRRGLMSSSTFM